MVVVHFSVSIVLIRKQDSCKRHVDLVIFVITVSVVDGVSKSLPQLIHVVSLCVMMTTGCDFPI